MAWKNDGDNKKEQKPFNVCVNWGLFCYEQKVTEKSVILKCSMNKKKKDSDEYTAPLYIDVVCPFETCEIEEGDYAKKSINVDGGFSCGEYENKEKKMVATMTIFATKVVKREK